MTKEITIHLDDKTYKTLVQICDGNESAVGKLVSNYIASKVRGKEEYPPSLDVNGLDDYLKSSHQGTRSYGTKGQGW
tara:strand:+ start:307 stop:537 length:231 start_codon:yes stop_codon:yes gene_type:complete